MDDLTILCDVFEPGTPLFDICRLINLSHNIAMVPIENRKQYKRYRKTNHIFFGAVNYYDFLPPDLKKIIHFGSMPHYLKYFHERKKRFLNTEIYFASNYYRDIIMKDNKQYIKKQEVMPILGPLPMDNNFIPIQAKRIKDKNNIVFLCIAKFWKRRGYEKRLGDVENLFINYLKKEYRNSKLIVIGTKKDYFDKENNIYYFQKSFHNKCFIKYLKSAHIMINPTSFDTACKTLAESIHYGVPFITSSNSYGGQLIEDIGKCGKVIPNEEPINSIKEFLKISPMNRAVKNIPKINYKLWFEEIKEMVDNYDKYYIWDQEVLKKYYLSLSAKWCNIIFNNKEF